MRRVLLAIVALILALGLMLPVAAPALAGTGAWIWTDKPDYAPGETVTISGTGFNASADVTVTIERPDGAIDAVYAVTDDAGSFTCIYQLDGIAGTYTVTATDGTNTAITTFTDANKVNFATSGLPGGQSITITGTYGASPPPAYEHTFSVTFTSPGPSSDISTGSNKWVTYSGFPSSVTVSGVTYYLVSTSPASPFHTGTAGGTITVTATYSTVDTTPPTVTIDIPDYINIGNQAAVPVTITSDEDGTYDYDISDGVTHVTGSGSITGGIPVNLSLDLSGLDDGTITADASVTDRAGNRGSAPQDTATKDTVAPTVTIDQALGQADPTNTSPINFTVVFSEPVSDFATGDVTLSSGTDTVTGSGTTYNVAVSGMSEGVLTASIAAGVAHDAAGNPNTASTSTDNEVTYDITPPVVTITAPADGGYYQTDTLPSLAYTVTDNLDPSPRVRVLGWSTDEGVHRVNVIALDAAGNVGWASVTYTVDNTPPVVTITAPADGGYYQTATLPALAYTVTDNLDPAPSVVVSGWSTAEGVHTVTVTATDAAGNVGSASVTYTVLSPAAFSLGNLSITPGAVGPGESVTICVDVTNTGGFEGTYEVVLMIDGEVEDTAEVTLAGGATQTVCFDVSRDAPGTYTVDVGGLGGSFDVLTVINWALIGGIIAAVVASGLVGYFAVIARRRLESISLTPGSAQIGVGETQQYTATGHYSDGRTADITGDVTWASSDERVATIASGGLATGIGKGTTIITATLGAVVSDPATLAVGEPARGPTAR